MNDSRTEPDHDSRRWSWRIGSLAGIPIYLHATFVLLLAWIALSHVSAGHGVALAARGLLLVASVFAVVVVHELSHALVARRFGIPTRDITLYPIGGIARLERMPERPGQELLVALAGPAINGVLALAIYVVIRLTGIGADGSPLTIGGSLAIQLLWINISLGAFNLLPAFPMDGGRILRAALAFKLDRSRATRAAAAIGRGLAAVMGLVGLAYSPWLAVIAIFVWMAAGREAEMERMKTTLRGVSVADAMIAEFQTLAPDTSLGTAASRLASGFQHDFPVVENGRVVGMLTRDDVIAGLATRSRDTIVAEIMHARFPMAGADEGLESALGRLPPGGGSMVVFEHDQLVGLLDPARIGEVLAFRGGSRGISA